VDQAPDCCCDRAGFLSVPPCERPDEFAKHRKRHRNNFCSTEHFCRQGAARKAGVG
jgi:hypothetical protein